MAAASTSAFFPFSTVASACLPNVKQAPAPHLCSLPPKVRLCAASLRHASSPVLCARKWELFSLAEGSPEPGDDQVYEPVEVETSESLESEMPPPVEAQIEASAAQVEAKGEDVFAVVMIGSRQYIVFPGRFIYTQRLKGANVNDKIILNKVLLVGTRTKAYIGQPVVTNAAVHAIVEEQGLDPKVIVFKYKKKKHYKRTIGHRQPNTRIKILGITGYENFPAETMPETIPA